MVKILIIFFILNFYNFAFSSTKEKILVNLEKTNNMSFYFIQTIADKTEKGSCIIKYSKKIYCEYDNHNKKILISNGKSLVIASQNDDSYYIYPLQKTPLGLLLDKSYLISKMNLLKPKDIENKYVNFTIFENNNEINIFFDKKTSNLIGWQTEDIYQNLTITFISSVKINQKIDDAIFLLPKRN
jgi:outer membrane lipoprotein-sorting protein